MELQRRDKGTWDSGDPEDDEAAAFLSGNSAGRSSRSGRQQEQSPEAAVSSSTRLAGALFAASWVILLVAVWIHKLPCSDRDCLRQLSAPSPLHDVIEYEDVQFDNALWKPGPYKGKPTADLEARWKDLWYYGSFDLPDSALGGLNKPADGIDGKPWARTPSGGLLAGLEVFHNLHCLDLVRQYVHRDHWDYSANPPFQRGDEHVLKHVDHCIESLRLQLMCSADVTPFLHTNDTEEGVIGDFDTRHRCPKYDRIVAWAKERQLFE